MTPGSEPGADDGLVSSTAWRAIADDRVLGGRPSPLGPGNVPPGVDLRLDIGWEPFEQLLAAIARYELGLNQTRFRRYGTPGQKQHGIDLAGRHVDGSYTVVQCKHVASFTPSLLRSAVEHFADGRRPFGARRLIVATSSPQARATQVQEELANLQAEYAGDVNVDLWGPDELTEVLRNRADIVARFWTRETAELFCTGAPLPGVAAPPPEWTRVADQVLLGPLGVDGLDRDVASAERLEVPDPHSAATKYGEIADRLAAEGFAGHAYVMWRRQLDVLARAEDVEGACAIAAQLAAQALYDGDVHQANLLSHKMNVLAQPQADGSIQASARAPMHANLIRAAIHTVEHPYGENDNLIRLLSASSPARDEEYEPLLVVLLAEFAAADRIIAGFAGGCADDPVADRMHSVQALIVAALNNLAGSAVLKRSGDLKLRLRLALAAIDDGERTRLLSEARQIRLPRPHAALVLAAEARRNAQDGSSDDAMEHWRQAVTTAIHDGRTDDASAWLYAIRALHIRFGPWAGNLDEEHLLAQALPTSTAGRIIRRVRDPERDARRAALDGRPIEAIRAARQWLAESIVKGDWVDEGAAADLLGDLYASNAEPDRAAACFQWAGEQKKLLKLSEAVGDRLLPVAALESNAWWQLEATLALLAHQEDLVPDEEAVKLVPKLLDLVTRGRAGELVEGPGHNLTTQATKTACTFSARGTCEAARQLLDLLAEDVPRAEGNYRFHDEQHVLAALDIADQFPELEHVALLRIVELADLGTHQALACLPTQPFLHHLQVPATTAGSLMSEGEREQLIERLRAMAASGRYPAGLAIAALGDEDPVVIERAEEARRRILERPDPDGRNFSYGTSMVPDSYLVTFLPREDQRACIEKLLVIAEDSRDAAPNRQDALTAACNLVVDEDQEHKRQFHLRSRAFVEGNRDGSALEAETSHPHPLSTMRIDFGSPSLRAHGLRLTQYTATTDDERTWVRDQAVAMLGSNDVQDVHAAAQTLAALRVDIEGLLDPALLASHPAPVLRQLAVIAAVHYPSTHAATLGRLAADPVHSVRAVLARELSTSQGEVSPESPDAATVSELLATLQDDARSSVRRAAAAPSQ